MLITESQLMEWSDHRRREKLAKWLREMRIPYFIGKGGALCTTSEAVNRALAGETKEQQEEIDFA